MHRPVYHTDDLSQYTFLVTGGAGFIGSHLAEYLVHAGALKVVVLDNLSTGSLDNVKHLNKHSNFLFIKGDITELNVCKEASERVDYVLHQAALGSVPRSIADPIKSNEVNVSGFLNMLVAARDNNVKRFIYAASSSTYGDSKQLPKVEENIGKPLSPYAVTKYVNELYAEVFSSLYSMQIMGLRYFNVFGPRQNPAGPYAAVIPLFIEALLQGHSPSITGDGEQTRDFTFVENVIKANILALFSNQETGHEVMNVACGERTTLNQVWNILSDYAGGKLVPTYIEQRKGDVKDSLASIDKAKRLIGYSPEVLLKEGLEHAFTWYQSHQQILEK
jgi:UDP-N-acetylglucosamine/UDP-N-acetylgalactosamine 4-epimerase